MAESAASFGIHTEHVLIAIHSIDQLDRASAQVMVGYSDSVFDHGIHKQGRKRRMIKLYKVQSEGVKKRVAPGAWPKRIA